jgi:hypothetical protein
VKGRLGAEQSEGRGAPAAKQVPPRPGTVPALGLRAGKVAVAIVEQTTLVKEIAMWFRALFDTLLARSSRTRSRKRRLAPSFRRRSRSLRLLLEILEDRTLLSTYTVNSLTDTGAGSGLAGDLRYCITHATSGSDTITSEQGLTGTINLTGALPDLTHSISIDGPGPDQLTVRRDTGGNYRIFTVDSGTMVSIAGLTIANGLSDFGGGILNAGCLTLANANVSGNVASAQDGPVDGGGIWNGGTLTLDNSTVSGNSALGNLDYAPEGGGVLNAGTLTLDNSTISGNSALGNTEEGFAVGGGICDFGILTLDNSTVFGNSAAIGGGLDGSGLLTLNNSTVSGNLAAIGGGIVVFVNATLHAQNTIFAGNGATFTDPDLAGNLTSSGHNLIGNTQGGSGFDPTDLLNVDPMLGSFQDNGGPTKTMDLLAGSPTLNAGDPTQLGVPDQRGVIRSGGVNIGAYQASASVLTLTGLPSSAVAGTALTATLTAKDIFGQTAVGYTGTVHFSSTDGQAALPADYPFTLGDGGVHVFSNGVTLKTAGKETVTTTDIVTSSITGSASVSVTPAAADHLVFLQQPTDTAAGQTISPVVAAVVDQFGNVETEDNSDTITLSLGVNPSGGTLSGTLTLSVVNGVATFSDLSIDLAGMGYNLHATIGGALPDIDSNPFNITM